jgi:hypothetical protein
VAQFLQRRSGLRIERRFDIDREVAIDLPARRIAGGLRLLT